MKKTLLFLIIIFSFTTNSFSAGSSGGDTKSKYDQAVKLISKAKKNEEKGKKEKAEVAYEKALKLLIKSNKDKPDQPNTLNYLGFATRKLGNYEKGEEYYLLGLKIDPNHIGINEYLGELYVVTNRIELAKQRLNVLKNCNCKEYEELKQIIDGKKKSKY